MITDATGAVVPDRRTLSHGHHRFGWDGRDERGRRARQNTSPAACDGALQNRVVMVR
jgi:flagellar hook assembly protein FlgD